MTDAFIQLGLFSAKAIIILFLILIIFVVFFALLARSKDWAKGRLTIKNLNDKYEEANESILAETLSKKQYKKFIKAKKKDKQTIKENQKVIFVLNFHGDIKASAVTTLSEEINAILNVATPSDEVVVKVESGGGLVYGYGLAAAQLLRIRAKQIPLTVVIDKIAASGGYMMACVANKILSAPFAIIGSIGVIVQLPNFHRALQEKHIDFEQLTAGEYKRTLTLFGENTEEGREKLQQEIDSVHNLFKALISEHRPQLDIQKVATGEHWLGQQALTLKLVDEIQTSDEYLLESSKKAKVFEIGYEIKKPFMNKFTQAGASLWQKCLAFLLNLKS